MMKPAPSKDSEEYKAARLKFSIKPPSWRRALRRKAEIFIRESPELADDAGFWECLSARQVYRLQ
jgi:hypothetical protein